MIKRNLEELRKSQDENLKPSSLESLGNQDKWSPPPLNCLKINTNAAWNSKLGRGRVGWILRDSLGSPLGVGCKHFNRKGTIKSLEMLAIKEGIEAYLTTIRNRGSPIVVESDASEVIKAWNFVCEDISDTKLVMNKVEELVASAGVIAFVKGPRARNRVVHSLARAITGLSSTSSLSIDVVEGFFELSIFCDSSTLEEMFFCGDEIITNWLSSLIQGELVVTNSL